MKVDQKSVMNFQRSNNNASSAILVTLLLTRGDNLRDTKSKAKGIAREKEWRKGIKSC